LSSPLSSLNPETTVKQAKMVTVKNKATRITLSLCAKFILYVFFVVFSTLKPLIYWEIDPRIIFFVKLSKLPTLEKMDVMQDETSDFEKEYVRMRGTFPLQLVFIHFGLRVACVSLGLEKAEKKKIVCLSGIVWAGAVFFLVNRITFMVFVAETVALSH